jgi:predicted nucleotidyltransferase
MMTGIQQAKRRCVMRDDEQIKRIMTRVVEYSEQEFGKSLKDVILFGSYARGDFDKESDIDIMILVDRDQIELKRSQRAFSHLSTDIDLGYDVVSSLHLQDYRLFQDWKDTLPFYREVDRDGVSAYA